MVAEAIIKFVGAMVLIELGFGVLGAVAAISASVVLAYCLPDGASELRGPLCRRNPRPSARPCRPSSSLWARSSSATSTF